MSNSAKQKLFNELTIVFDSTEEVLTAWTSTESLKFPHLLDQLAAKLDWDEPAKRRNDPFVRGYIHSHPDWKSSRGAKGGIQRASVFNKKLEDKQAKEAAKREMAASIEAKTAAQPVPTATPSGPSIDDEDQFSSDSLDDTDEISV
jgi:hypothetical protein